MFNYHFESNEEEEKKNDERRRNKSNNSIEHLTRLHYYGNHL